MISAYGALQWLGRTAGSSRQERQQSLPGDDLVERPHFVTDHAVTIDAPPSEVWPWLVQMGWHRGGWYTSRWVDVLLFPANQPAAERIHPEWQGLVVGETVPDGPPESECFFVVRELEPERHLVLHSRSHLPPEFRDRFGAWLSWSWTFVLRDLGDGRTRFQFRSRGCLGPPWLSAAYSLVLVPADFVMGRQMLGGVKRRAEGRPPTPMVDRGATARLTATAGALGLMLISPAIRPFHLRWGATPSEVSAAMPGDDLVPGAQFIATRAVTIDAPPAQVWPWLQQVGFGRGGFYSYDLLDGLGRPSSMVVLPEWQDLGVGDVAAPMAEPATTATSFTVTELDAPRRLLWSKPDSTWAWTLEPVEGDRTRLVTRLKVRYRCRPDALLTIPLIELGDFAMMRRMLLGLRDRAERHRPQTQPESPTAR
jgi:hypothetical protein